MVQQYEYRKERVRQIAQAALELIAEVGLRRCTTRAIAEKVGITDGTIFRHFKNKEEIVLAAMDLLEEIMFTDSFPDDKEPLLRLENFFRKRAFLLGSHASMGRLMFSEQLTQAAGDAGTQKLKSWRARNTAFVARCLQELEALSRLPSGLEARDVAVLIQGTLLTFAFERTLGDTEDSELERRIDRAWGTICRLLLS